MMSLEQEDHVACPDKGHKALVKQDSFLDEQDGMGVVTTEDEGYETPGSKMIDQKKTVTLKNKDKESILSEDDGYETGGKKQLLSRPKGASKDGKRSRGSPRAELSHDRPRLPQNKTDESDSRIDGLLEALDGLVTKEQLNEQAIHLLSLVPKGYIPLPHQVGGHRHIDGKPGFLRRIGQPHLLYKPVQYGSKGVREVSFYDALCNVTTHLGDKGTFPSLCKGKGNVPALRSIIPIYYGLTNITDRAGQSCDYLILEDITHRFTNPCIMDLKMGQRVWDDHADQAKIERELKKYPAQETLGFRIVGMRIYKHLTKDFVYYDRFYGRSVREDTALEAIRHFFEVGDGSIRSDVIRCILAKLTDFVDWMEKQGVLRLFATSLLIVYEGGPIPEPDIKTHLDMRLVDFAHTYEKEQNDIPDGNALYGIRRFIEHLNQL